MTAVRKNAKALRRLRQAGVEVDGHFELSERGRRDLAGVLGIPVDRVPVELDATIVRRLARDLAA